MAVRVRSWSMWLATMSRRAPDLLVITGASADAEGFRAGDLDEVDVVAMPDGLEQGVGEAEDQNILHGLLAEVMVDPEHLLLVERTEHRLVERARRGEIASKGLFHDDARPAFVPVGEAAVAEVIDDIRHGRRGHGKIKKDVGLVPIGAQLVEGSAKFIIETPGLRPRPKDSGDAGRTLSSARA